MSFLREPFPEDVANRVLEDYVEYEIPQVFRLLEHIRGGDPWQQLACLRLASGHVELLPQYIELANRDSRDLKVSVNQTFGPGWERDYILFAKRTQ
jgi:hypothetical protein